MQLEQTHRLLLTSDTQSLLEVERLIDEVCADFHIDEDFYGNVLIAVTEAVNNAIVHGNKLNQSKHIEVICEPAERELLFQITDQGNGFDFNNIPDPTSPENVEKPHGRGIFLMKNLADEVSFYDNGKKVALRFKISAN
ncbi:MAG: ATP-binding protein [Flavobacteriales bacterium]|nr:ATP-binding protein [Flavobacteriales bacterium]